MMCSYIVDAHLNPLGSILIADLGNLTMKILKLMTKFQHEVARTIWILLLAFFHAFKDPWSNNIIYQTHQLGPTYKLLATLNLSQSPPRLHFGRN